MCENTCGDVYSQVEADTHPHWVLGAEYKHRNPTPTPNDYYKVGGIEVIDYVKAKLTPEQYKGYLIGNIYKYSGRCQYKGEYQKDVVKLAQYTNWLLKEGEHI